MLPCCCRDEAIEASELQLQRMDGDAMMLLEHFEFKPSYQRLQAKLQGPSFGLDFDDKVVCRIDPFGSAAQWNEAHEAKIRRSGFERPLKGPKARLESAKNTPILISSSKII